MEKIKVAIFPAGSEIGLEIHNALKYEKYIEVIGLTSAKDHSEVMYEKLEQIPYFDREDFIEQLNQKIKSLGISYIYPAYDDILLFLTENQEKIDAKIISSDLETIRTTRSKMKTYEYLSGFDFVPEVFSEKKKMQYPIFAKPDIGQGSQGVYKIENEKELDRIIYNEKKMVFMEYLPGAEYTIDCFTDKKGNLLSLIPRTRDRIKTGIAVRSRIISDDKEFRSIGEILNKKFMFNGAWFFQVKKDKAGRLKLLEIAARIPGSMGLTRNMGINYPLLTIYNHMEQSVSIVKNSYEIFLERALFGRYQVSIEYNSVYVDLDDTLIIDGKVNLLLVQFLYQCKNLKKRVFLITRHGGDLVEYLARFSISSILFDEIYHLDLEEKKSNYIFEEKSIFIDDSFRERKDVADKCNIPVFGPENVECLLDWKM